eukprot:1149427-Pelagomonas_calceolata.AAC.2
MRMRTHLHAELIQAISNVLEHSPHPGAGACIHAAALKDTGDIALPDARDPFYNFYWLSSKSSHGTVSYITPALIQLTTSPT